jgi:hypothetical protein
MVCGLVITIECEDGLWFCNYEFGSSKGIVRMVYGCVITNLMVPMEFVRMVYCCDYEFDSSDWIVRVSIWKATHI